jgi:hypothetical protein
MSCGFVGQIEISCVFASHPLEPIPALATLPINYLDPAARLHLRRLVGVVVGKNKKGTYVCTVMVRM